jgi:hypothetical protein
MGDPINEIHVFHVDENLAGFAELDIAGESDAGKPLGTVQGILGDRYR